MRMKIGLLIAILLLAAMGLAGCYESNVPMASSRQSTIDQNLLGAWKATIESDGKQDKTLLEAVFYKFNDHEYYVRYKEEEKGEVTFTDLRVYTVVVNGVPFFNVHDIESADDSKRSYNFFRYSLSGDGVLTLKMVIDRLFETKFDTSEKLYEFIQKNLENEKLYGDPIRFVKIK